MTLKDYIFNSEIGKIKIDFPSSCNANCIGCYSHAFNKNPKDRLSLETIKRVLDESNDLGVGQLVIAADGEPLIDKDYFFDVIGYANQKGMESIVYTNGSLITPEIANKLYGLNTSLLVKRNSMNHQRQNNMLRTDLSEKMLTGVNNLIDAGFDSERLAIDSFISKYNERDLEDVLRFCRTKGITPYFEEFICVNQSQEVIDKMVMTPEQLLNSFKKYQEIDKQEFGIETEVIPGSRRYGIAGCSLKGLMSVDTHGNVKKCIFDVPYGNINNEGLRDIQKRMPNGCEGCSETVKTN
jgi:MoaA/NifB/PqqE/SkfB family radical SAM enzyme